MGKHALERSRRRPRGGARRATTGPVRPRYGRIAILVSAVIVTTISVAGGLGIFPSTSPGSDAAASTSGMASAPSDSVDAASPTRTERAPAGRTTPRTAATSPITDAGGRVSATSGSTQLPARSGSGRRVVFSESAQRVWLVEDDAGDDDGDEVVRTYLASGSIYDNLDPGTYEVFSRSRHAVGIDDSGTMEYFVRFTYGNEGAAIGFHSIPVADGEPVQTLDQLGTPLSHGCIRQRLQDAIELWDFAPIGTTVVVTA
ncbi:L,D-transpeptidase family protein [Nocardioides caeni]|uniref:L,D-TPase catalytic domain-containing protein n=1 Tax=Nocardioides caeni TaxID=574700 RepID=A0A4S8NP01_9ACTN|nr:L,D-transpeptidase [Nocardioides caeni]THV18201.1 hypothetical protein E9934_00690 [Nocardioides caeni]